ncbi:MAG: hypothetical protein QG646_1775 [Euryarchaeota archaeon]|nr:hypothetical protein [Euryarchaeota archaeon]
MPDTGEGRAFLRIFCPSMQDNFEYPVFKIRRASVRKISTYIDVAAGTGHEHDRYTHRISLKFSRKSTAQISDYTGPGFNPFLFI